jgi:hypothetical protein
VRLSSRCSIRSDGAPPQTMQQLARTAAAHTVSPRRACVFAFVHAQRARSAG